ncbi:MAG: glycosyltransferase, partial [Proteobacteria bacterium]|nr:glycosyltransferase [Pseudomonadota bacterium]
MRDKEIKISVVIPVYNSTQTLRELRERLEKVLVDLVGESYEIVFVNDGSSDSSWYLLNEMAS